jgi:hypothetical protein
LGSFREGWKNALDWVQKTAAKFASCKNDSNWERLAQRKKIAACICALHKASSGAPAWKDVGDRLKRPYYLSRVNHYYKIRKRKQRLYIGKYSFVNRTIKL